MQVAALGEGGCYEPDAGEEEDEGHDYEHGVGHDVVRKPCAGETALFHWNVSSFLYAAERMYTISDSVPVMTKMTRLIAAPME